MQKTIIGLSGGFTMEPQNPLLDLYILKNSPKKNPKICLLPTACADDANYVAFFEQVFEQFPCETTYLNIFSPKIRDMEDFLLSNDIIYVGGGNTKSMLALWREWGVDHILKQAYDQGTVLAGCSAGFVCWFKECVTDSLPRKYSVLPCLGLLEGSSCPHYDGQKGRQEAYHHLLSQQHISEGYAIEDGVGLHFVDGKLVRAISSSEGPAAYHLTRDENGQTTENKIQPDFLGTKDNIEDLMSIFETEQLN